MSWSGSLPRRTTPSPRPSSTSPSCCSWTSASRVTPTIDPGGRGPIQDAERHLRTRGRRRRIARPRRVLRARLRAYDITCRIGGEEIVIVVPGASAEDAGRIAEELRRGIEELVFLDSERPIRPVTASFGVSAFPSHGAESEELLRAADQALYRAKDEGRNRVSVAPP